MIGIPPTIFTFICIPNFNKEVDKVIEEMKLKVVYTLPNGSSDDSGVTCSENRSFKQGDDDLSVRFASSIIYIGNICWIC